MLSPRTQSNKLISIDPSLASTLPTASYQGIYTHPTHGTVTIFEAGTALHFDLIGNPESPDLNGVLAPRGGHEFAIVELPLLGYIDYADPVMKFMFLVVGQKVEGFRAVLGCERDEMVFRRDV